jgi:two-component system nitrate/nitrite response regulator NarL
MMLDPACEQRRILLVDDHGLVRHGIRALLDVCAPELDVDEAGSFEEALQHLQSSEHSLSLVDLDLGSTKTGLDLLEAMHRLGRGLPAIVLSGHDNHETVMQCLDRGASGFITKAADDDGVFRQAIETVLAGQVYLPRATLSRNGPGSSFAAFGRKTPDPASLKPSLQRTLVYLHQGLTNKVIAERMHVSEYTARDYCSELYRIFGVAKRSQLMVELARRGIVLREAGLN